ncbi:MAG: carbohydrate kinase [Clostridiales bacterium]|nr:carbohydrate kinase [Clostridiales bacterium]
MYDVTALGELLIDFTPSGTSASGQRLFEQNPGGAPANVLAALNNCGLKTAFLGKIGDDMHGLFLKETLKNAGIDCTGLIIDKDVFTTLAFVALNEKGERTFSFARKPGADTMLRPEEVNVDILKSSKIFHIGSLSLTNDPSRSATVQALKTAKEAGVTISYDPNYRAPLWDTKEEAMEQMRSVVSYVDVMKISDEETSLLTPKAEPEKAAAWLVEHGVPLVAVTLGSEGAYVCTKEGGKKVSGFKSQVADTTGAGDSFWGGFLFKLVESGKKPADVTLEEAETFARFGNAVASLCVEKRGGIPAIPKLADVEARLNP